MSVSIMVGDCLVRMKDLADSSVDSVVCDPPYHLTQSNRSKPPPHLEGSPYSRHRMGVNGDTRAQRGFMGQEWDGGDVAFRVETWAEVLRVLKPGGHLVAFSGTRTYHRLACAIEDAGFEVRDMIAWHYGAGFPKSHNIDKALSHEQRCTCKTLSERDLRLVRDSDVSATVNTCEERGEVLFAGLPEQGSSRPMLRTESEEDATIASEPLLEGRDYAQAAEGELQGRPVCEGPSLGSPDGAEGSLHHGASPSDGADVRLPDDANGSGEPQGSQPGEQSSVELGTVADERRSQAGGAWPLCAGCGKPIVPEGLGTALKPATEPICLARKPLSEKSIAANVLRWGCGALNIDACRVSSVTGQLPSEKVGWDEDRSLCGSCAVVAERQAKSGTPATKESIATRSAEPTLSAKEGTLLDAISRTDTGCSDGTKAASSVTNSNIAASGKPPTGQSPQATTFTTSTTTEVTTGSRTCRSCGMSSTAPTTASNTTPAKNGSQQDGKQLGDTALGRWPANLCHDGSDEVVAGFPAETGVSSGGRVSASKMFGLPAQPEINTGIGDSGSAARYFYTAKASSDERGEGNSHPTVKPIALMRWLSRLVTPKGGTVLDPFMGSGSTLIAADAEQFNAIGCELSPEYAAIAERRLKAAAGMFADVRVAA